MQKHSKKSKNRAKGAIFERAAMLFMKQLGWTIFSQNYREKTGEIDIIALKANKMAICEVKGVTYETSQESNGHVTHETNHFRAISKINHEKRHKIRNTYKMLIMKHPELADKEVFLVPIEVIYDKSRNIFRVLVLPGDPL